MTEDGRVVSSMPDSYSVSSLREIRWAAFDLIWVKPASAPRSNTFFIELGPNFGQNSRRFTARMDAYAQARSSKTLACIRDRSIMVVPATKSIQLRSILPKFFLESVEIGRDQPENTKTNPSFEIEIRPPEQALSRMGLDISRLQLRGEIEILVTPRGGRQSSGIHPPGEPHEIDLDGAHWSFVPNPRDASATRFSVDVYKDDTQPKMVAVVPSQNDSQFYIWQTTRAGDSLLVVSTSDGRDPEWNRIPMRLEPGSPEGIAVVHNGLSVDSDTKIAIMESGDKVYRCAIEVGSCRPIASRAPDHVEVQVGNSVVSTRVLDWHCAAGR